MTQQGQVFPLTGQSRDGMRRWAYRYRVGGRGSRRVQRGGFASEQASAEALDRVLEQLRPEQGLVESPTLTDFVEVYLAQHDGEPETTEKLLAARKGGARLRRASAQPASLADDCGLADDDPARASVRGDAGAPPGARPRGQLGTARRQPSQLGVENPQRRYTEKPPFESWEELYALAGRLGARYGPMVLFAAATGLRPGGMPRARAQRHRSRGPGRLRPPHLQKRPHQDTQDQGERARGSLAGDRPLRPRRAIAQSALPALVSVRAWRLPRPA
jgi:hypothetical protein